MGKARFVPIEELFAGRHFDAEIEVLCVRWYLSFKLSYRDLVSMISAVVSGWRHARPVSGSWRIDETYVKVRGEWVYLYRAVDKAGKDGRLLFEPATGYQRGERSASARQSDAGCVRGVTSRRSGIGRLMANCRSVW